jgi:hypothetical protein
MDGFIVVFGQICEETAGGDCPVVHSIWVATWTDDGCPGLQGGNCLLDAAPLVPG